MSNSIPVKLERIPEMFPDVIPTLAAVKWIVRIHRRELNAAGAIARPVRELMIIPEPFMRVVADIGVRKAGGVPQGQISGAPA